MNCLPPVVPTTAICNVGRPHLIRKELATNIVIDTISSMRKSLTHIHYLQYVGQVEVPGERHSHEVIVNQYLLIRSGRGRGDITSVAVLIHPLRLQSYVVSVVDIMTGSVFRNEV